VGIHGNGIELVVAMCIRFMDGDRDLAAVLAVNKKTYKTCKHLVYK